MTQDIMFMHFRPRDLSGHVFDPRGGATLAIRHVSEDAVQVATARCSTRDVFNRKLGRTISEGRLNSSRGITIQIDPQRSTKDQIAAYYEEVMESDGYA